MNPSWPQIAFFLCLSVGLAGVLFTFRIGRKSAEFAARAVRLQGLVIELVSGADGEIAPKYSFRDAAGVERTGTSNVFTYPSPHFVGKSVEVLFDPITGESRLNGSLELHGAHVMMFILSAIVSLVGVVGVILNTE